MAEHNPSLDRGENAQGTEDSFVVREAKNEKSEKSAQQDYRYHAGTQHRLEEARSIVQPGTNSQVGPRDELAGRVGIPRPLRESLANLHGHAKVYHTGANDLKSTAPGCTFFRDLAASPRLASRPALSELSRNPLFSTKPLKQTCAPSRLSAAFVFVLLKPKQPLVFLFAAHTPATPWLSRNPTGTRGLWNCNWQERPWFSQSQGATISATNQGSRKK
jgi:hypothetical protein